MLAEHAEKLHGIRSQGDNFQAHRASRRLNHRIPARWFERLGRVLPNLHLTVNNIWVKGWPWKTTVIVQWDGTATLLDGGPYRQHAVHLITLRWGKIHALDVFEDSQEIARALEVQATAGLVEAVAEPIVS